MRRSAGMRFFIVGLMALVMFIPVFFVSDVILERGQYSDEATRSISDEWGGAQQLLGPVMVLPVEAERTVTRRRQRVDPVTGEALIKPDGQPVVDLVTETVHEPAQPIWLFPETLDVTAEMTSETRYRGIFSVPVYKADTEVGFNFDTSRAAALLGDGETIQWDKAVLRMRLSSNRALRRAADLRVDGQSVPLEPVQTGNRHRAAIEAALGDPRTAQKFALTRGLNGAEAFHGARWPRYHPHIKQRLASPEISGCVSAR
jgi:inner membrane protein